MDYSIILKKWRDTSAKRDALVLLSVIPFTVDIMTVPVCWKSILPLFTLIVDLSKTVDALANTNISDSPFFRCLWYHNQRPITVHTPDEHIFAYWGALGIILIYNCNDRHGPFTWNMCIQNKFNNYNTKSSNGKPARMRELFTHVACKICACVCVCGLMCKMFRICEWVCVVARAL